MVDQRSEIAARLRVRMEEVGYTQETLAEAIGVTQGTISLILTGKTRRSRILPEIAKKLEVSLQWLMGETDDPSSPTMAEPRRIYAPMPVDISTPMDDDLVRVHEIDLTFGMGATYLEVPVTAAVRRFDRNWLRGYTKSSADKLFFCEGIGNSMSPSIESHDLLLIDTGQKEVRISDQIWAVAYGACGSIKRLRPMADGSIKMMCDNPSVSDEVAYDGELQVIGRVVAIVRKF